MSKIFILFMLNSTMQIDRMWCALIETTTKMYPVLLYLSSEYDRSGVEPPDAGGLDTPFSDASLQL